MKATQNNTEQNSPVTKPILPIEHEDTEQHLNFTGDSKEVPEGPDPVNLPEHHITKEEFDQRESGQAPTSSIPPPDDAPRGL